MPLKLRCIIVGPTRGHLELVELGDALAFNMKVQFDPTIFSLGQLHIRWYGFMYFIAFSITILLLKSLVKKKFLKVPLEEVNTLILYIFFSMFFFSRLFYVTIYNWGKFSSNPIEILYFWNGGLSFHGAFIGLLVASYFFSKRHKIPFLQVTDAISLAGCQGIFWGRIGNFINGELYGTITSSPLGLIFAGAGPSPRHPSQLYEGVFEGLVLSLILWYSLKKVRSFGTLTAIFTCGYGLFRFVLEYYRQPDQITGMYFGGTTTIGQVLCLVMVIFSLFLLYWSLQQPSKKDMYFNEKNA